MKNTLFSLVAAALAICLTLAAGEIIVRLSGGKPFSVTLRPAHSSWARPDPVVGWSNRPGVYLLDAEKREATFLAEGSRRTLPVTSPGKGVVAVVGGSYTMGMGVRDDETYTSVLQERFPSYQFVNYGSGGYGAYQSLLTLEKLLATPGDPPIKFVIYGFIGSHPERSVATPNWIFALKNLSGSLAYSPPRVSLEEGRLIRHKDHHYQPWPLASSLAVVHFAQNKYLRYSLRNRHAYAAEATFKIIKEMDTLCRNHDATLLVAMLQPPLKYFPAGTLEFLQSSDIPHVDCTIVTSTQEKKYRLYQNGVYGHPNEKANRHWGDCIGDHLHNLHQF